MQLNRPMYPRNDLQLKLKSHTQSKSDLYTKMFHNLLPKPQSKHVSFDSYTNSNNNNSSRINLSSSSSSSTPQQYSNDMHQNFSQTRSSMNKYQRTDTRSTLDDTHCKLFVFHLIERNLRLTMKICI